MLLPGPQSLSLPPPPPTAARRFLTLPASLCSPRRTLRPSSPVFTLHSPPILCLTAVRATGHCVPHCGRAAPIVAHCGRWVHPGCPVRRSVRRAVRRGVLHWTAGRCGVPEAPADTNYRWYSAGTGGRLPAEGFSAARLRSVIVQPALLSRRDVVRSHGPATRYDHGLTTWSRVWSRHSSGLGLVTVLSWLHLALPTA